MLLKLVLFGKASLSKSYVFKSRIINIRYYTSGVSAAMAIVCPSGRETREDSGEEA